MERVKVGVSDSLLFPRYIEFYMRNKAASRDFESVAFLGFQKHNLVTEYIASTITGRPVINFYDLELNSWDINANWFLNRKYDLIVSLRCPYFAKDPVAFLQRCNEFLNDRGSVFLDFSLGDNWRYDKFRIGWCDETEREFALYNHSKNYLWSAFFDEELRDSEEFNNFCEMSSELYNLDVKKNWDSILRNEIGRNKLLTRKKFEEIFKIKDSKMFTIETQKPQLYSMIWGTAYA